MRTGSWTGPPRGKRAPRVAYLGGAGEDGGARREVDTRVHLFVRGLDPVQQLLGERDARARP